MPKFVTDIVNRRYMMERLVNCERQKIDSILCDDLFNGGSEEEMNWAEFIVLIAQTRECVMRQRIDLCSRLQATHLLFLMEEASIFQAEKLHMPCIRYGCLRLNGMMRIICLP